MSDDSEGKFRKLRHDIASPLAAILAETQLLLLNAADFDEETVTSLKTIETAVRRIKDLLAQG
jgi:signal transduction histidine kinase